MKRVDYSKVDTERDTIVTAARKLGGINSEYSDFANNFVGLAMGEYFQRIAWAPLVHKLGMSPDRMCEHLQQLGYLPEVDVESMLQHFVDEVVCGRGYYSFYKTWYGDEGISYGGD